MVRIVGEDSGVGETPAGPDLNGTEETPSAYDIFNAPDYASLITSRQSRKAREYTVKVNSVLKAFTIASVNNGDLPDAAALLQYGPPWAHAVGQLADSNENVARAVDLLTSPSSPAVMFTLTSITLVSQILRNHEAQIAEIPNARKRAKAERKVRRSTERGKPRFTVRVFGRSWPVYFRTPKLTGILGAFRTQTQEPESLTYRVFSDTKVQAALEKNGIRLRERETQPAE